ISRDDAAAGGSDERFANAPAFLSADRNVLQIRFARRQPPGHRDGLSVTRVHAACGRGDPCWQLVAISRLPFRQAALPEQRLWQRIVEREFLQDFFVGGWRPARSLLHDGQLELAEQDLTDLFRRAEIERLPGERVRALLQFEDTSSEFGRLPRERLAID